MKGVWLLKSGLGLLAAISLAAACGDEADEAAASGGSESAGPGSGSGAGGPGSGSSGQGGLGFGGGNTGGSTSGSGGGCAGQVIKAEQAPLDLYIMLDSSGSMSAGTGPFGFGTSKWDSVRTALDGFYADPQSAGVSVALQFFPLAQPGVPSTCSTSADCNGYGPCFSKLCDDGVAETPCDSDADCSGVSCVTAGQCLLVPYLCTAASTHCTLNCITPLMNAWCANGTICTATEYATPAVAFGALPMHASALTGAAQAKMPDGRTPTSAALQGAVDYASAWAAMNPDHKVAAVLATDGLPTECAPVDTPSIAAIASTALAANPSIPTFVIGVFADVNAQTTVDTIAQAGGTQQAFLVDPGSNDVTTSFQAALDSIRSAALECEYNVPQPGGGQMVNYGQVNVEHTPSGGASSTLYYVGDASGCDGTTGGWFYDTDPTVAEPSKILVCTETCDVFKMGGEVNIQVGCDTILPPK
jgi:hypothetical protein